MDIQKRIEAFEKFGELLKEIIDPEYQLQESSPLINAVFSRLYDTIQNAVSLNPWFTPENVKLALHSISESLACINIKVWIEPYLESLNKAFTPLTIGVVMAGNIPLVGFFDFFHVLISGNKFLGKLSSDDNKLLPLLSELLIYIEPEFKGMIEFREDRLDGFDAIIATGSDNTSRYFDYYFGKYPHIIRKNRTSVAVLSGKEKYGELSLLGMDIFSFFGLGCRNISKLYIPRSFSIEIFFNAIKDFKYVIENSKYNNNYDYYKSIYMINKEKFYDNGFLMLKENPVFSSPVSNINFEYYDDVNAVKQHIDANKESLQCIVSSNSIIPESIPFGTAQYPQLWDYADNVDTMEFLLNLS